MQSTLNTKAGQLVSAINNNIPTPAPIISQAVVDGSTVTVMPELPSGYTPNTWFYQVVTEDENAENPYEGQTLNTEGAPESIQLTGLTEGASYTIRIANWSGPVSQYVEAIITIPQEEIISVPSQPSYITPIEPIIDEPVVEEPVIDEPVVEEPIIEEPIIEEPIIEEPIIEEPIIEEPANEEVSVNEEIEAVFEESEASIEEISESGANLSVEDVQEIVTDLISDSGLDASEISAVLEAIAESGEVSAEIAAEVSESLSEGGLTESEAEFITEMLSADGEITTTEVVNLSESLNEDGKFTLAEKDLVADVLVSSAEGAPVNAANIEAAGLEYRDLPPTIPVEVREDANGNPVVIQAEVASALLVLESPAAIANAIATCFNPEEAIEGLTEEQKCELGKALLNMGADMSIPEREKAEDIVVVTIIAGQIVLGTAYRRKV